MMMRKRGFWLYTERTIALGHSYLTSFFLQTHCKPQHQTYYFGLYNMHGEHWVQFKRRRRVELIFVLDLVGLVCAYEMRSIYVDELWNNQNKILTYLLKFYAVLHNNRCSQSVFWLYVCMISFFCADGLLSSSPKMMMIII